MSVLWSSFTAPLTHALHHGLAVLLILGVLLWGHDRLQFGFILLHLLWVWAETAGTSTAKALSWSTWTHTFAGPAVLVVTRSIVVSRLSTSGAHASHTAWATPTGSHHRHNISILLVQLQQFGFLGVIKSVSGRRRFRTSLDHLITVELSRTVFFIGV